MGSPFFPESDKLAAQYEVRDALMEFLSWLTEEKQYSICLPGEHGRMAPLGLIERERLVLDHLGINEAKLEEERRAMLDGWQSQ